MARSAVREHRDDRVHRCLTLRDGMLVLAERSQRHLGVVVTVEDGTEQLEGERSRRRHWSWLGRHPTRSPPYYGPSIRPTMAVLKLCAEV